MSGFSLHPQESESILQSLRTDPAVRDEPPTPGFFDDTLGASGRGLKTAAISGQMTINTFTDILPDSFFEDDEAPRPLDFRGVAPDRIRSLERQESNNPELAQSIMALRPDPMTTGMLGQIGYGLTSMLPQAIGGGLVGGPVGAAVALGLTTGVADYEVGLAEGLDQETALQRGILMGGTNAVGAFLPASLGGTILSRLWTGAALNVGVGVGQRGATAALLNANGYEEMADQYRAFSGTEMLIDGILGAAFGAMPTGVRPQVETPVNVDTTPPTGGSTPSPVLPSDIDLALSGNAMNQLEIDAAPGVMATAQARNTHVQAMDTAYQQLMRNEPVNVEGILQGDMLPKVANPEAAMEMQRALEEGGYGDLMAESERLREEALARGINLEEELDGSMDLTMGEIAREAGNAGVSSRARAFIDRAQAIRNLIDVGGQEGTFTRLNRNSSNAVKKALGLSARPVPLAEWVRQVGGISSGLTPEQTANLAASGQRVTDFYSGELRDIFDGRKNMMNRYVRKDGLSMEDALPSMAAEQGYLGDKFLSADYRAANPQEMQQVFYDTFKRSVAGEAVYDVDTMRAIEDYEARAAEESGEADYMAADTELADLSQYGLRADATVGEIAEALALQDAAIRAQEAADTTQAEAQARAEYLGLDDAIPFLRAQTPETIRAFAAPVDADDVNPLGFYSQLSRVAQQKLPGKGTGADFSKAFDAYAKQGDFKPEELEYSGVKEWLSTQDKVTKADVIDFLKGGGVKLEEVTLGEIKPVENLDVDGSREDGYYVTNYDTETDYAGPFDNENEAYDALNLLNKGGAGKTKYGKYTLPGGENYREVLMTLPEDMSKRLVYDENNVTAIYAGEDPAAREPHLYWYFKTPDNVFQIPKSRMESEAAAKDYIIRMKQPEAPVGNTYQSGHWDQKNVLAHFRLKDYDDGAGGKVLLIEEIQSDWHQAGRKKGYKGGMKFGTKDDVRVEYMAPVVPEGHNPDLYLGYWDYYRVDTGERITRGGGRLTEAQAIEDALSFYNTDLQGAENVRVPDAPFKKTWGELSFKRILRMAAENGYSKVAWTPGEIQNDRFDLSTQINLASARANGDGTYNLIVEGLDGQEVAPYHRSGKTVTAQELEDTVGKDVAKKLVEGSEASKGKTWSGKGANPEFFELRGIDLKVGGEGMKGFYDDILPKMVGKVIGKLDKSAKVGDVKVGDTPDEFYLYDAADNRLAVKFDNEAQAQQYIDTHPETTYKNIRANQSEFEVHGFDMTEELRERVMMGLPQFNRVDQTATPAFKAWFGDSKVVDEAGQPLRVYHGTGTLSSLEQFKPEFTGRGNDALGSGFYFTNETSTASGYTVRQLQRGLDKLGGEDSPGVVPVYLSIKNPIVVDNDNPYGGSVTFTKTQAMEIMKRAPDMFDLDESPMGNWVDVWSAGEITDSMINDIAQNYVGPNIVSLENDFFASNPEAYRKAVNEVMGYDGVVQTFDSGETHYVAWFPEQIKSATGNRGTFDPADPRITFNRNEAGVPAEATPFGPGMARIAADGMSEDDLMMAAEVNATIQRLLPGAESRPSRRLYATEETGAAGEVYGAYRRPMNVRESRGVVDWALEAPDAVGVARHEVIHGLKRVGLFTDEEWSTLTTTAMKEDWIGQTKLADGYRPEQMLEEAIAERFKVWRRSTPEEQVMLTSRPVYAAFLRLARFLSTMADKARRYMGLKPNADDVFARVESGMVGRRTADDVARANTPMTAADMVLAETPYVRVPTEDGMVDGKLAMMEADADAMRAEMFGPLHDVAVNCFMRG